MVCYTESSLNRLLVKLREFIKNLLVRIQGTRHLVHYARKFSRGSSLHQGFVVQGFNCIVLGLSLSIL